MHRNNWLLFSLIVSLLFLLGSYIPNFYEASIASLMPADRVMTPAEHMYTYDYNVYLAKIRQGIEGRWSIVDKYDNNINQRGVFLQMIYLLSGKLGIFGLSPPLIFHLLRTVASVFWVLTIIYLNFYFLGSNNQFPSSKTRFYSPTTIFPFLGVLLSLLAASWPVFYQYQDATWIGMYMSWWQEMDVLKRISYLPHYTLNYIIIAVLTILLSQYQKSIIKDPLRQSSSEASQNDKLNIKYKSMKQWSNLAIYQYNNITIIAIVLFLSFFIHPSSGLLFLISWFLYHFIRFVWKPNIQYLLSNIYFTFILFLVAAIPLIYFQYVTSDYPWKGLTDYDKYNRIAVNVKEYIMALGPIFYTGVAGAIIVLIKKEQKYLSLVTWILGAFLAIFAFKKFPLQSELRFVQTANHIPLAILSVYFITKLNQLIVPTFNGVAARMVIRKTSSDKRYQPRYLITNNVILKSCQILIISLIVIPIITLGLAQSYFSIKAQTDFIHQRVVAGQPLVPYPPQVMYPLKDMFNAFIWLDKNTKNEEIVLSHIYAGNYIPAYAGNYVYLGHNTETPHYGERVKKLELFYSGTMNETEAKKFLKEERISYVLFSPQEKQKSVEDTRKYKLLKEAFNSGFVKIYKTNLN